jgi:hypothetical protein
VSAGATPLSNNASFHKKKSLSQQSSFSTSGEDHSDSSCGDNVNTKSLYRKMSSGEIPPAIEPRSEWSRRVQCIIDCARQMNSMKPGDPPPASSPHLPDDPPSSSELKIVWGGEINSSNLDVLRFGVRLVEDSIYGKASHPCWWSLCCRVDSSLCVCLCVRVHVVCGLLV